MLCGILLLHLTLWFIMYDRAVLLRCTNHQSIDNVKLILASRRQDESHLLGYQLNIVIIHVVLIYLCSWSLIVLHRWVTNVLKKTVLSCVHTTLGVGMARSTCSSSTGYRARTPQEESQEQVQLFPHQGKGWTIMGIVKFWIWSTYSHCEQCRGWRSCTYRYVPGWDEVLSFLFVVSFSGKVKKSLPLLITTMF